MAWISGALLVIGSIVYAATYTTSVNTNGALIAYAATTNDAYVSTARLTENIQAGEAVATTLPFGTALLATAAWGQNNITAQRWAELRDNIALYNRMLAQRIAIRENWFLRLWVAPVPEGLAFISFPTQ